MTVAADRAHVRLAELVAALSLGVDLGFGQPMEEGDLLLADLDEVGTWDAVIAAEPALAVVLAGERFDAALAAVADFVDLKTPYALGHARGRGAGGRGRRGAGHGRGRRARAAPRSGGRAARRHQPLHVRLERLRDDLQLLGRAELDVLGPRRGDRHMPGPGAAWALTLVPRG